MGSVFWRVLAHVCHVVPVAGTFCHAAAAAEECRLRVFGGGGLLWGVYWYCRPPACGVWVRALPPACVGAEVEVENPGTMLLASWALWDALVQRMLRAQDLVAPEADPFRLPCPLLLVSGGSTRSLLGAWKGPVWQVDSMVLALIEETAVRCFVPCMPASWAWGPGLLDIEVRRAAKRGKCGDNVANVAGLWALPDPVSWMAPRYGGVLGAGSAGERRLFGRYAGDMRRCRKCACFLAWHWRGDIFDAVGGWVGRQQPMRVSASFLLSSCGYACGAAVRYGMPFSILLTSPGGLSIDLSQDFAGTYHSLPFKRGCEPQCLAPVDGLIYMDTDSVSSLNRGCSTMDGRCKSSMISTDSLVRMDMRLAFCTLCFCAGASSSKPYLSGPVALFKGLGASSSPL
ncbi:unnamed protein product [Cladocopium goreaui]|uniref:Uncharacterized protein n=1 Tax=Cladocopium goreaui TaxID=2562237 RepID=A0A9P1BP40_9DINO|nr:unnamed protein product [Cladocopium goreaui]